MFMQYECPHARTCMHTRGRYHIIHRIIIHRTFRVILSWPQLLLLTEITWTFWESCCYIMCGTLSICFLPGYYWNFLYFLSYDITCDKKNWYFNSRMTRIAYSQSQQERVLTVCQHWYLENSLTVLLGSVCFE